MSKTSTPQYFNRSVRFDSEDNSLLESLASHLKLTTSDILRIALRRMHEFELLRVEKDV